MAAVAALLLAACSWKGSMRPTVNLTIDTPAPHAVQAWGYPRAEPGGDWYNSVNVDLQSAAPFVIVLPDGRRLDSRHIDAAVLEREFAPLEPAGSGKAWSRRSDADAGGNQAVVFHIGADGIADSLWIYACGRVLPRLLATADGSAAFDFPLREADLERLFGPASRHGQDFVILGYACD